MVGKLGTDAYELAADGAVWRSPGASPSLSVPARVAQLAEHLSCKQVVEGSIPSSGSTSQLFRRKSDVLPSAEWWGAKTTLRHASSVGLFLEFRSLLWLRVRLRFLVSGLIPVGRLVFCWRE